MSGLGIRLYTDEMIDTDLAPALRQRGYDVVSCKEAGRSQQRISDEDQLLYATQDRRAILTYNVGDFLRLDARWKATGRAHAGIVVSAVVDDVGELLRRIANHLDMHSPQAQADIVLWLGNTPGP